MQNVTRVEPPDSGTERVLLNSFLDYYRSTLLVKCVGLSDEQLKRLAVPPSGLSLLGMVRHMTDVETYWFDYVFSGRDGDGAYSSPDDADADFHELSKRTVAEVETLFLGACERSRDVVTASDLDTLAQRGYQERRVSLRWILIHMIEEYARHCGHADLLRECIDGETGD